MDPDRAGQVVSPAALRRGRLVRADAARARQHRVIEYVGEDGQVTETVSAATQREVYLAWCREHGVHPAEQTLG
jgi:hypothetical protein